MNISYRELRDEELNVKKTTGVANDTFFINEVLLAKTLFNCPQTRFGFMFNFRGKKYPLFSTSKL